MGWHASWTCPFPFGDTDRPLFRLGIRTGPFSAGWGYGLAPFPGILRPLLLSVMELSIGDTVFCTTRDSRDSSYKSIAPGKYGPPNWHCCTQVQASAPTGSYPRPQVKSVEREDKLAMLLNGDINAVQVDLHMRLDLPALSQNAPTGVVNSGGHVLFSRLWYLRSHAHEGQVWGPAPQPSAHSERQLSCPTQCCPQQHHGSLGHFGRFSGASARISCFFFAFMVSSQQLLNPLLFGSRVFNSGGGGVQKKFL